jgi:hypothetical protein
MIPSWLRLKQVLDWQLTIIAVGGRIKWDESDGAEKVRDDRIVRKEVRRQNSGVRSQKTGVRSRKTEVKMKACCSASACYLSG